MCACGAFSMGMNQPSGKKDFAAEAEARKFGAILKKPTQRSNFQQSFEDEDGEFWDYLIAKK